MEKLIQCQTDILESIKVIDRNFTKDSASRKTREYLDERLNKLDKLWAEFKAIDDKLAVYEDPEHPYFAENQREKVGKYFESVRNKIASFSLNIPVPGTLDTTDENLIPGPSKRTQTFTPVPHTSSASVSQHSGQIDEFISLQRTNFRALRRLIRSINVEEIADKWELEDELRNVQSRWKAIDSLHLQIDNILQGSNPDYDDEFYHLENSFKSIKRALNLRLASTAHLQQSTPQLEIPVFTGRYTQWPTFYDLYCESIHNNSLLTKAQKMQHLKGKLRGEAERLVQHLHISADNYDAAWELLVHRYNNPQVLFTKHIEIFLTQPAVHKQTASELKRLYDTSMESIHAIENLGVNTTTWDPLLVHLIAKKLDPVTYADYKESRKSPRELPTMTELMEFLESKFIALEPLQKRERDTPSFTGKPNIVSKFSSVKPIRNSYPGSNSYEKYSKREFLSSATSTSWSCPYCNQNHVLYKCNKFYKLKPDAKLKTVHKLRVCQCCLYRHYDSACTSTKRCKYCHGYHHTILHDACCREPTVQQMQVTNANKTAVPKTMQSAHDSSFDAEATASLSTPNNQHIVNHVATDEEEILLTTLSLRVKAVDGTFINLRGLLDQGSQISLISERAVQMLGLPRQRYHGTVSGIGHGFKHSKGIVSLTCQSIHDGFQFSTEALIITHVINNLPNVTFNKKEWSHLQHINLADPEYNVSRPIDLLLDASVYSDIIMSGLIKGPTMAPIAQQTKLGWILSGNVKTFNCNVVLNNLLDLSQYWELEEINDKNNIESSGEGYCEQLYKSTTTRSVDGRYQVALPMKSDFRLNLGLSKSKAIAQFRNIEIKMLKNKEFSDSYIQFMSDYEKMEHMKRVININTTSCYLPHHGIMKSDSSATQLRTVFNASSKTSSGYSLNDLMERGPNLQKDLPSLIINWRQHRYVITADIEKMFRQILVREEDQHLQRIVWRASPQDPITDYQLTTLIYGIKACPYLAMRTLRQIAIDNANAFPLAAKALQNSFYMDDLLEGCETIPEAQNLQLQIITVLKGAGMNIRKWSSNCTDLIKDLASDQLDTLDFKCLDSRKTLGISWNPKSDSFSFQNKFQDVRNDDQLTKRQLLSYISRIFDPLGWLSPLTVKAKLLFQRTWSDQNILWDDKLSDAMKEDWKLLKLDFQNLDKITIPRYLGQKRSYEIHGFCDSSERAYACCIYVVALNSKGVYTSTLVTAKTKLAPIKHKQSLPRLELCGALLLSRLLKRVIEIYNNANIIAYAWTDSMVVLGWIHGDINRWKKFVSTRVQKIIDIIPSSRWHHVKSEHNAADCATRGLNLRQLLEHPLWWEGPKFLLNREKKFICNKSYKSPSIDIKSSVNVALYVNNSFIIKLLDECSSMQRVVTTVGWLSRYITWLRGKQNASRHCYLSVSEITSSYNVIIKTVQHIEFSDDIYRISRGERLRKTSKLLCLNPYIDKEDGLLKVGGRLSNSILQQSSKHPIIIPSHSRLTELLINQAHLIMLHGGPSLTLSHIREKYWIPSGLRTVKRELRKCTKCRRFSSERNSQIMADLPKPRVTPSRPFTHTGVDFTGHFGIRANKGRGIRTNKGYVAVFVCLSSKAVHLELVSDLSTPGFLAAFRRFCSRRGTPSHMYSDNGTNFVGANRLLKREYHEILQTINENFFNEIRDYNVQWVFNAAAYPSAGGIWEAAVKRFKYHLRRVVGEQRLTYEEFITLLHQIEACLNSRPLIALTESPDDLYLTPGHFLIGGALISRPQTDPCHINLTTRWHMVQAMNKQIWKCWSSDYLQQLQRRSKWTLPRKNVEVGDVVVIKEENLPPGKWALGRVTEVHPGKDGHVRVVSLRTTYGDIKRPVLKLSVLPVKESQHNEIDSSTSDEDAVVGTSTTQTKKRPRRPRIINFVTLVFLLFFSIICSAQSNYNISFFKEDQSIYFDKVADLRLIMDEWKVIVYHNMTTYWSGLTNLEDYVTRIDRQSNLSKLSPQYKSIVYQLKHDLTEIEHYNSILLNKFAKRQKRGLINGVGYLANSLFGVLDERFADRYEKDIEKITLNENHLQLLLKNQTSIIEGQYNIMRRNEDIMNKQFEIINTHLREMEIAQLDYRNELTILSSAFSANTVIVNLRRIQDYVLNVVTDISQDHINAHLLPPDQLAEQINIISSHLQGDITLPIDKFTVSDLYKLMKVNVRVTKQFLMIQIKIPLVAKESLQLDHMLSLPHRNYLIEPIYPYVAFNLEKNRLLLLSPTDIQTCVHMSSHKLLCAINKPVYELHMPKSICNLKINNKTTCTKRATTCEERWINLQNHNRWLFSCCEKCLVRLFCPAGVHQETLTGNGIIDIGQGCILKSNDVSIYGHNNNNYLSNIDVQIDIAQIGPETSILNKIINSSLDEHYIPEDHGDKWNQLRAQIDDAQKQSSTPLSVHDIHQYSVLYAILSITVLAVATYLIMRWYKLKQGILRVTAETTGSSVTFRSPPGSSEVDVTPSADHSVSEVRNPLSKSLSSVDKCTLTSPLPIQRSVRLNIPKFTSDDSE